MQYPINSLHSVLLVSFLFFSQALQASWHKTSEDIMGTRILIELAHSNEQTARNCTAQALQEFHRIDQLMSPYKPNSEVSLINYHAAEVPVKISDELYQLIKTALHYSKLTEGAFDITFASVGHLYDYRQKKQPSSKALAQHIGHVNYKNLIANNGYIKFAQHGMKIDLGGIAKGYAVDQSIQILKDCGIQQALVSAGGDSRIIGDKQGRPWVIGLQHPRKKEQIALSIPLSDSALSTSGDYERFFLSGNQRIHHIINPKSGKSAKLSWSTSVLTDNATSSDALSTSLFILGAKKGMDLINSIPNTDAIIIDAHGQVHYSSGLTEPNH